MSTMSSKLVTGGILAVIGLIALKVVMFVIGGTVAIFALLFKLLPIILLVWLGWKLIKYLSRPASSAS
jgi:ABC-type multidrug transport system fused ATPase/permease subunit